MEGVAPDITPVSYPNRNPPVAARAVRILIRCRTVVLLSSSSDGVVNRGLSWKFSSLLLLWVVG